MNKTFKIISAIALLCAAISCGKKEQEKQDPAHEIALSLEINGKNGWATCWPFAQDLHQKLQLELIESEIIIYNWQSNGLSQKHAVVLFKDAAGRYWIMDNQTKKPVWVNHDSPISMINQFSPFLDNVEIVEIIK